MNEWLLHVHKFLDSIIHHCDNTLLLIINPLLNFAALYNVR